MIERIYNYMTDHNMVGEGSRVLAAVSGGADSMCLLEVLRELRDRAGLQIAVLHVHHGLRESADGDLLYVAKYCEDAGIPFEAVHVDAAGYAASCGLSVEEAARKLRYEALEQAAERWDRELLLMRDEELLTRQDREGFSRQDRELPSPVQEECRIAVAHHIEDQAETVLFNLVRGSRLTGLRGMLPVNGRIIRPLLTCSREEIEEFLKVRGISWREDETNEDVRYSRNLIRKEVMPLLEQINISAREHIARAAEEAAETEEFLREQTERASRKCIERGEYFVSVSVPELMREPPLIRRRVIYCVIADVAGRKKDLQDTHVQAVLRLAQKNGNGRLDVFGGVRVEKVYDRLLFSAGGQEAAPASRRPIDAPGQEAAPASRRPIDAPGQEAASAGRKLMDASRAAALSARRWPMDAGEYRCRVFDFDGDMSSVPRKQYTKWLDYDKIGAFPSFRTRCEGDRITLDETGRSKTIARYMIDTKVPAELRGRIVLPTAGSEILWIPAGAADASDPETGSSSDGGRMSAAYKVSSRTGRILEICWEPGIDRTSGEQPETGN